MAKFDASALELSDRRGAVRLSVRVKPRSSRGRIIGVQNGALVVAVAAPPVDGAANRELCKVLARALGVARSAVVLAAGAAGRSKLVDVSGVDAAELRARIAQALS